ncbi:winged helix-turn-helix domain-containing protein [Pseudonocardia endophytica]|uniref:Transcriptional regulator n=1 Tax=Pseudonocardia endophytica TaxID=401976 RepID=A0A4R1HK34_PSEEN|nr:winged helix-turn-helix domain-containing protein [Pseudonocardia endophytica]TCK19919.1 transcriptional regulator [Pseudonocardia endophytica]
MPEEDPSAIGTADRIPVPRVHLLVEVEAVDPDTSPHDVADAVGVALRALSELSPRTRAASVSVLGSPHRPQAARGVFDVKTQELVVDGAAVRLTPREATVLSYLVHRPSRPVSRQELCEGIGDSEGSLGPRAVDVILSRLRAKLTWTPPPLATVRGVGYRYEPSDRFLVIDDRP